MVVVLCWGVLRKAAVEDRRDLKNDSIDRGCDWLGEPAASNAVVASIAVYRMVSFGVPGEAWHGPMSMMV